MTFSPQAIAGIILCAPSGVKGYPKTPDVRQAVKPSNPLVPALNGKLVRARIKSQLFPRIEWPHPLTVSLEWPEDDDSFTSKQLRAMANDWDIIGRSKARTKPQLQKLIRDWREGK